MTKPMRHNVVANNTIDAPEFNAALSMSTSSHEHDFQEILGNFVSSLDGFSRRSDNLPPSISNEVQLLRTQIVSLLGKNRHGTRITENCEQYEVPVQQESRAMALAEDMLSSPEPQGLVDIALAQPPNRLRTEDHDLSSQVNSTDSHKTRGNFRYSEPPVTRASVQHAGGIRRSSLSAIYSESEHKLSQETSEGLESMIDFREITGSKAVIKSAVASPEAPYERTRHHRAIPFDIEERILVFRPDQSQWPYCFEELLQQAKSLGADRIGAFKIYLQHIECPNPVSIMGCTAYSYRTHVQRNGTVSIRLQKDDFLDISIGESLLSLSKDKVVMHFETNLESENSLRNSRYCTDLPARNDEDRIKQGLSVSPIWPLKPNKLINTKRRVPGIHWPYAYKSNATIGAVFACHVEDWQLHSLNVLYEGSKVWIIVPPSGKELLESKLSTKRPGPKCAQFVRENAVYIPTKVLQKWGVPYSIMRQSPKEIVVTLPETYHQGFSVGSTFAEAVNYADNEWNPKDYKACTANKCPRRFIGQDLMAFLDAEEEQISASEEDENESEHDLATDLTPKTGVFASLRNPSKGTRYATRNVQQSPNKRKQAPVHLEISSKKSMRINQLSSNFNTVASTPEIPPLEIFERFCESSAKFEGGFDDHRCMVLTKLFYAIASPDAISQLRDAYRASKSTNCHIIPSTNTIAQSISELDKLDNSLHLNAILRRFHLVSLRRHRDALLENVRLTRQNNPEDLGTAGTLAHRKLMLEAYPDLNSSPAKVQYSKEDYNRKSKALTHRCVLGHRWSLIAHAFAPGILALIPTQGDYGLSNS
ncbi:MAG: hypothetical protein MMC23_010016, partial [Stictis urceolatum]|nr:hypothetical protein [Stictis urceolata]